MKQQTNVVFLLKTNIPGLRRTAYQAHYDVKRQLHDYNMFFLVATWRFAKFAILQKKQFSPKNFFTAIEEQQIAKYSAWSFGYHPSDLRWYKCGDRMGFAELPVGGHVKNTSSTGVPFRPETRTYFNSDQKRVNSGD